MVALIWLALGCRGDPATVLSRLEESRRLAAELPVRFSQAAEASNRAVMADTDEGSIAAAGESEKATQALEHDAAALAKLLESGRYSKEAQILHEFDAQFSQYSELDRRILALAVENTNLKARSLSFGAASQTADGFRDSLRSVASSIPVKDRCRVDALITDAVRAVREIQVLHAPHIGERDDATMTHHEKQMADLDTEARVVLASLKELSPASASPTLAEALAKLDQFKATTRQIIELSRRNTNVLSLDLSLRQKPALATLCNDRLRALQDALAKEGFPPGR